MAFGHGVMLELAAVNAGIDLDPGDSDATDRLRDQLLLFIEGARILHYKGDVAAKEREVAAALERFRTEFVEPALVRRRDLIARRDRGEISESDIPRDILGVMLENVEGLDLDGDTMLRETAFFLLTGASTSAVALTRTLDNIFRWIADRPADEARLTEDPAFVQRCIIETLRLAPISPIAARWSVADFTLADGTEVQTGDRVHIDMAAANRDPAVFGSTAEEFDPDRELPDDVPRHGVSFGHGMHACIGQELAVGVEPDPGDGFEHRLFGLVGVVVQELVRLGVRPDPDDAPMIDPASERGTFSRYPVVFNRVSTPRPRKD
jgi:cytochrome P450